MEKIMRYKVSFDKRNVNDYKKTNEDVCYVNFGGNTFMIDNKEVPFDFEAFGYEIEEKDDKTFIEYESGKGLLWDEYELDECFDDEYEKLGLNKEQITAKFLASTEEIIEMYISCEEKDGRESYFNNMKYEYIEFEDLKTKEVYRVKQEVIDNYNNLINEKEV